MKEIADKIQINRGQAEADAVQTHNAADAIKSAWGADVVISKDGSLSLK